MSVETLEERTDAQGEGGVVRVPRVRSWSDVVALTTLLSLFFAGIVWGMKLEARYDKVDAKVDRNEEKMQQGFLLLRGDISALTGDVSEIKVLIQKGILPVTEERTHSMEERIEKLERKRHPGDE